MENENFVPEIDLAVQLPQAPGTPPEQPQGIDLRQLCQQHGLGDDDTQRLEQVLQQAGTSSPTPQLVEMLALAMRHDDDVSNADATGYLRGRNENIEQELARLNAPNCRNPAPEPATFPRYTKRSIWD